MSLGHRVQQQDYIASASGSFVIQAMLVKSAAGRVELILNFKIISFNLPSMSV